MVAVSIKYALSNEHVLKKLKPLHRESSYSELFSNQVFLQTPQMVFKLLCPRQILAQRQRSITGVGGPLEKGSILNSHEESILNSHEGPILNSHEGSILNSHEGPIS
uniref:Uncharacterized protein n=1 Tax=Cacopsylla melanoneura TaxID=428564 RepID=A0A8D9ALH2_9HEMI